MPVQQAVPTGVKNTEPATLTGTITSGVAAIITLLVAFGLELSEEQTVAIMGVVAVAAPIIQGIVTRGQVYAPSTVQRIANHAVDTGDATIDPPPAK